MKHFFTSGGNREDTRSKKDFITYFSPLATYEIKK